MKRRWTETEGNKYQEQRESKGETKGNRGVSGGKISHFLTRKGCTYMNIRSAHSDTVV